MRILRLFLFVFAIIFDAFAEVNTLEIGASNEDILLPSVKEETQKNDIPLTTFDTEDATFCQNVVNDRLEYARHCLKSVHERSRSIDVNPSLDVDIHMLGYSDLVSGIKWVKSLYGNSDVTTDDMERGGGEYSQYNQYNNTILNRDRILGIKKGSVNAFYDLYFDIFRDNNVFGVVSSNDVLLETQDADFLLLLLGNVFSKEINVINLFCGENSSLLSKFYIALKLIMCNNNTNVLQNIKISSALSKSIVLEDIKKSFTQLRDLEVFWAMLFNKKFSAKNRYCIDPIGAGISFESNEVRFTGSYEFFLVIFFLLVVGLVVFNVFNFMTNVAKNALISFLISIHRKLGMYIYGIMTAVVRYIIPLYIYICVIYNIIMYVRWIYGLLRSIYKNIQQYVFAMGKIYKLIEQDAILSKVLCDKLQHCRRLFKIDNTIECEDFTDNITFNYDFFSSAESKMLDMLVHIDDSSSFFNIDLCEFFVLFDHFKDLFIKPMLEMADIETYISIHEFINSPEQKGHWCLAELVEDVNDDGGKPYICANDVWNPFLAPDKAIKNTIELGGKRHHSERFAILSGINYGGKTTLMNAITYAIIMSHLFGVAPAKRFKTSRFAKIHVMNSGDTDIINNDSKFSKEIRLCGLLLHKINTTKQGNIWLNSDEMFSGTDPNSAEEICKLVMEEIANKSDRTMGTYATHYSLPTELGEKDRRFKNYHMGCEVEGDDINFTRILEEGRPVNSIAMILYNRFRNVMDSNRDKTRYLRAKANEDFVVYIKNGIRQTYSSGKLVFFPKNVAVMKEKLLQYIYENVSLNSQERIQLQDLIYSFNLTNNYSLQETIEEKKDIFQNYQSINAAIVCFFNNISDTDLCIRIYSEENILQWGLDAMLTSNNDDDIEQNEFDVAHLFKTLNNDIKDSEILDSCLLDADAIEGLNIFVANKHNGSHKSLFDYTNKCYTKLGSILYKLKMCMINHNRSLKSRQDTAFFRAYYKFLLPYFNILSENENLFLSLYRDADPMQRYFLDDDAENRIIVCNNKIFTFIYDASVGYAITFSVCGIMIALICAICLYILQYDRFTKDKLLYVLNIIFCVVVFFNAYVLYWFIICLYRGGVDSYFAPDSDNFYYQFILPYDFRPNKLEDVLASVFSKIKTHILTVFYIYSIFMKNSNSASYLQDNMRGCNKIFSKYYNILGKDNFDIITDANIGLEYISKRMSKCIPYVDVKTNRLDMIYDIYKNKKIVIDSDEKQIARMFYLLFSIPEKNWNWWTESSRDLYEFFALFDNYKDIFIKPILEMADIETYISINEFINSPEQKGHWCLAEFVEDEDTADVSVGKPYFYAEDVSVGKPYVYAEDVWNPFLSPSKAIKNTIELGGNKVNKEERFAVLSGVNYGGKTTLMNAITYAIIMSHLFGVAPAKRFKTSRFAKIHVMNSGDTDIANNDSKFSKEIRLCSLLLDKINNTNKCENVWVNSDEMFSGTDPASAGTLCRRVMCEIADRKNTIGMYATHYYEPTTLYYDDIRFKNYHMGYNIKDKDIEFTNRILEGKPEKSIAKYLLRKVILRDKIPYFDDILKRFFPDEVKK